MKLVVFGLSVSSSWGNGHATLWRGLCRALGRRGHHVVFFERDVPYYAAHRDLTELPGGRLVLYRSFAEVGAEALRELADADIGMVTSFCPDACAATELVIGSRVGVRAFYDLDTPVTLRAVRESRPVEYLGPRALADFDLVLSFTGGSALDELCSRLGARRAVALYGSVDGAVHAPAAPAFRYRADLSYLGTYAEDRSAALEQLFLAPARCLPAHTFLIGGAQYPVGFPWTENMFFVHHVPPAEHPRFFSSCRLTLNVTRAAMAELGFCPSGRLFEAAACGAAIVSDVWPGLEQFFTPGEEILIARDTRDVLAALDRSDEELGRIARAARERVLVDHSADHRAAELEAALDSAHATPAG